MTLRSYEMYKYIRWWRLWFNFIIKWFSCTRTAVWCPRMLSGSCGIYPRRGLATEGAVTYWLQHGTYRRQNEKFHDSYRATIIITRQQGLSLEPTQSQLDAITTLMTPDFNVNLILPSRIFVSSPRGLPLFSMTILWKIRLPLIPCLFLPSFDFGFGSTTFEYSQITGVLVSP